MLVARERALGPEHLTLAARDHLAGWTGLAGDPAGARDQLAALLPLEERVLGPDTRNPEHPRPPRRLDRECGGSAGARDQLAALLPVESGSSAPSTRKP